MNTLLVTFIILNIVNVIMQTVKSIATVKCGKGVAALVNAITFALYTVVTVYTMCNLPLFLKASVVAICNLIGVYVVKWIEEKARKDKLWKIEVTVKNDGRGVAFTEELTHFNIPFRSNDIGKHMTFDIYCATQTESAIVKKLIDKFEAKYFASESKALF